MAVKIAAPISILLLLLLTAGEVLADAEIESNNTAGTANTLTSGVAMLSRHPRGCGKTKIRCRRGIGYGADLN